LVLLYALRGGAYDPVVFEAYGLIIWWALAVGIAVGVLPRCKPSWVVLLLIGAMLAYAAWTALSLTWTESAERTTVEIARTLDYAGLVALLAISLDRDTWRSAAAGLGFGALTVCVLAVASRLLPGSFPADYVGSALHTDRLSYPLGYWNAVAAWGAMSTAVGLAWSAHEISRARRALTLALVPAACVTTYLTYSRAGVVGTAVGVILAVALSRNRITAFLHTVIVALATAVVILAVRSAPQIADATGTRGAAGVAGAMLVAMVLCAAGAIGTKALRTDGWSAPRAAARPLATVLILVVILPGAVFGPRLASRAWHSFTHPVSTQSADPTARLLNLSGSRYLVWKSALSAFDHKPITGTGAGTFAFWWNRHATDYEFLHDTHNIWLQNMAELGAPGLLLIVIVALAALATAVVVRRRARRRPSAGAGAAFLAAFVVFLVHATVDWMWESTAVTVLALAGIAVIGVRLSGRAPRLRWYARAGLVALAAIAGAAQVPGLLSTTEIRRSQTAERQGNAALALAWANDAVSAEPWAAAPYEQRGLVLESAGRLGQAAQDLHRAISHERTNFTHWLLLSRIETERGAVTAAASDYRQAHKLRPLAAVFQYAPYFRMH
jgi:hypothetical protein